MGAGKALRGGCGSQRTRADAKKLVGEENPFFHRLITPGLEAGAAAGHCDVGLFSEMGVTEPRLALNSYYLDLSSSRLLPPEC